MTRGAGRNNRRTSKTSMAIEHGRHGRSSGRLRLSSQHTRSSRSKSILSAYKSEDAGDAGNTTVQDSIVDDAEATAIPTATGTSTGLATAKKVLSFATSDNSTGSLRTHLPLSVLIPTTSLSPLPFTSHTSLFEPLSRSATATASSPSNFLRTPTPINSASDNATGDENSDGNTPAPQAETSGVTPKRTREDSIAPTTRSTVPKASAVAKHTRARKHSSATLVDHSCPGNANKWCSAASTPTAAATKPKARAGPNHSSSNDRTCRGAAQISLLWQHFGRHTWMLRPHA